MLKIGSVIDGKYKILNKIGQGGMSVVYLAMNEKANRQWAVKEVRKEGVLDFEVVRQSLIRETDLLKQLKHPNLLGIADIIETEDTMLIVMDYIEGVSLDQLLREAGAQPQDEVVKWARQLCDVFSYLHSQDPPIIYRDLKPSNIMLKPDGNICLIDFGTARQYKSKNIADTTCLGTIGYAAPEQFAGEQQRQTDARTDIYNLGATLYHLLTGQNPSEPPYEIYPIRQWNPLLSTGLEKIILKCTKNNPEDRFQSCEELRYALDHFYELDDSHLRRQKRKLAVFMMALLLAIGGFGCGGYGMYQTYRQQSMDYNGCLAEAALQIAVSEDAYRVDPNIISIYQKAIDIDPFRSEAYLQMMDYYLSRGVGQTNNGVMALSAMIASGNGKLKNNSDVMMKMAQIYFSGNPKDPEFLVDYAIAHQYFSLVDESKYPQASYYLALSDSLSRLDTDWTLLVSDMHKMQDYLKNNGSEKDRIEACITLANIYRANAPGIQETGENPLTASINLLKEAEKILANPYVEERLRELYLPDIYVCMADSYYRRGNLGDNLEGEEDDFENAIAYYNEYLAYVPEDLQIVYRNRIADLHRSLKRYRDAERLYKDLIRRYPEDPTAYLSYAAMALTDMKNVDLSYRLFEEAKQLSGIENNANYQSLRRKLQSVIPESEVES